MGGAGEEECSFGRDRTCQCDQKIWCLIGVTAGLLNMKGRDKLSLLHFGLQPESSRAFSVFLQVNVSMHL